MQPLRKSPSPTAFITHTCILYLKIDSAEKEEPIEHLVNKIDTRL